MLGIVRDLLSLCFGSLANRDRKKRTNVHPCVARHPVSARHRNPFSTQQYQILARSKDILGMKSSSYPLQFHII
jgi:hypothetical protein